MQCRYNDIGVSKTITFIAVCILAGAAAICRLLVTTEYAPDLAGKIGGAALVALIVPALCLGARPAKVSLLLCGFIGWATLSTLINRPNPIFRSWEHLIYFALALVALSPLLTTPGLQKARKVLWKICVAAAYATTVFEMYFWCLNIGQRPMFDFNFFSNFMFASCVAAFAATDAMSRALLSARSLPAVAGCLTIVMLSAVVLINKGSRIAIIGFSAASIYVMVMALLHGRYGRVAALAVALSGSIACICCTQEVTMEIHRFKQHLVIHNGATYTRDDLWGARVREIKESPIWGIGFTTARHNTPESMEEKSPQLKRAAEEPGSSLLSVGACTGLVGLAMLLWFNASLAWKLRRQVIDRLRWAQASYWVAILLLLWIMSLTEGWMLYGGSFIFLIYWLATGNVQASTAYVPAEK